MFVLSIIKDTIPIHPSHFGVPPEQALIAALNTKYSNRVVHDVGLAVCVFDLAEAGEGKVRYGDGLLWYKVVFRMVVFRPFPSEVILAKVKSSDEDGIRLSIAFFDDMYIPASYLPQPSALFGPFHLFLSPWFPYPYHPYHSDPTERAHFWLPDAPDDVTDTHALLDTPTASRMYVDAGELVRARVEGDAFYDDEPGPPKAAEGMRIERAAGRAPYSIVCSIAEQGLGPVAWWKQEAAEADAMDEG